MFTTVTESALSRIRQIFAYIGTEACLFFIGIAVGSLGDIFSFWQSVAIIFAFVIVLSRATWRKNRGAAVMMWLTLVAFAGWVFLSKAPLRAGFVSLPGPDLIGLQRAGIEWSGNYNETVMELVNESADDYSDVDIEIGTNDQIYQVGEVTKVGCISLYGAGFRPVHRIRCPQLPGNKTIVQLAVVTAALSQSPISTNLFLPPRQPNNVTVKFTYRRGKRQYTKQLSGDPRKGIVMQP